MTSDKKSRLFGSIASRIFTGSDSFTITVWAVSESDPHGGHESYNLVFTRFIPTVTFDSMLHNVSLTYIYNALARKRVDKRNPPKRVFGGFCYEVETFILFIRCLNYKACYKKILSYFFETSLMKVLCLYILCPCTS